MESIRQMQTKQNSMFKNNGTTNYSMYMTRVGIIIKNQLYVNNVDFPACFSDFIFTKKTVWSSIKSHTCVHVRSRFPKASYNIMTSLFLGLCEEPWTKTAVHLETEVMVGTQLSHRLVGKICVLHGSLTTTHQ